MFNSKKTLAEWNDRMVKKYHAQGTLFESKNPVLRYIERKRLKTIMKLSRVSADDKVIDIGCGEGYLLSLLPQSEQIVGIDISRVALGRAKEILKEKKHINLIYGDAETLPFQDKTFDKVICSEMLEHVPSPRFVIREIHRILAVNGKAVISVPDEKRIQRIMRMIKLLGLQKIVFSARKKEDYEWHLHESNLQFVQLIIKGFFTIGKVKRVPCLYGYRFVVELHPVNM